MAFTMFTWSLMWFWALDVNCWALNLLKWPPRNLFCFVLTNRFWLNEILVKANYEALLSHTIKSFFYLIFTFTKIKIPNWVKLFVITLLVCVCDGACIRKTIFGWCLFTVNLLYSSMIHPSVALLFQVIGKNQRTVTEWKLLFHAV